MLKVRLILMFIIPETKTYQFFYATNGAKTIGLVFVLSVPVHCAVFGDTNKSTSVSNLVSLIDWQPFGA